MASASPTIQNTTITESDYCSITADMYSYPDLTDNTLESNNANGLCLLNINGDLDIDATWDITDTSYYLVDTVNLAVGKTLTIDSGVIVKFNTDRNLMVNGTLLVNGTEANPVYFTSVKDDTIGGDTNGNGVSNGARGDWRRIEFTSYSSPTSLVNHAIIRFGGHDDYYHANDRGAITLANASPTIQNTTITENTYAGILAADSTPVLVCNNILNNTKYGLENSTTNIKIAATNQWWGSSTGPYHETSNSYGVGNAVSDGVNFVPWLTAPCGVESPEEHLIYLPLLFP